MFHVGPLSCPVFSLLQRACGPGPALPVLKVTGPWAPGWGLGKPAPCRVADSWTGTLGARHHLWGVGRGSLLTDPFCSRSFYSS